MITPENAAAIARARAKENNWTLREPIEVTDGRSRLSKSRTYFVVSDPVFRGAKARFIIDGETGKVLDEGYIPR